MGSESFNRGRNVLAVGLLGVTLFLFGSHLNSHAADGDNVIANPSFEIPSSTDPAMPMGWLKGGYGTNSRSLTYPVTGADGGRAARIDISSYTSGDAKWYFTPVSVTPGDSYFFADNFLANVPTEVTIQYKKSDGTYIYSSIAMLSGGSGWQSVQKNFTVPAGVVSLTIFHEIYRVGFLVTDDFQLRKIVPTSDPANLIANPSLEIPGANPDLPKSWLKGGYGTNNRVLTYPVPGYAGFSAAKVQITSYTDGDGKWYFNYVPASSGKAFAFSDYYTATVPTSVTAQFKLSNGSYIYTDLGTAPPSTSWVQFTKQFTAPANTVGVTVFHALRSTGTLTIDAYSLTALSNHEFNEGMVSLTFDDGFISQYDKAFPIITSAGIPATFYLVTNYLNNFGGYMNTAQAKEINNVGNEADAHTKTHAHLTTLSDAQAWDEINGSKTILQNAGFTPVKTFAYPFGEYDSRIVQMVKDAGYIGARSVDTGYNYKDSDKYTLAVQHGDHQATLTDMKSWIDQAIADHSWLIIKIHSISDDGGYYSTPPATLQGLVDYINASGIKVVNMVQGIGLMNP